MTGEHVDVNFAVDWTPDDITELLRRVAEGRVKPVVHDTFPLCDIKVPFKQLTEREVFGKAVLIP